ncbi:MAG: orotidine 5'-phosphate decarboxylase [Ktedonobacteraceae bacterium]|nr:orotidine 5'-phosphate decarboxylase [Ktedonobacteraceae bacterium]
MPNFSLYAGETKTHWLEAPTDNAIFRRRRGGRSIQIALDCLDIERAINVAKIAKEEGADFLEVGDPLIKSQGVTAISKIKQATSEIPIVAEMMSADWGQDQVELAATHGADLVFLIGPASQVSVQRAVSMARRLGLILLLDVPLEASQEWCAAVQKAGVDGLVITTNIDIGSDTPSAEQRAAIIRRWSELPLAVSGGFSPYDLPAMKNMECDIVIIGRSVVDAVDPKSAIGSCVSAFKL